MRYPLRTAVSQHTDLLERRDMNDMTFRGQYWFLSNFYEHEMCVNGTLVATLEHAFQMCKTSDLDAKVEGAVHGV